MRVVNLTGHPLRLLGDNGKFAEVRETELRTRASSLLVVDEYVNVGGIEIPVLSVKERTLHNLPPAEDGVIYVVSGLVASLANRPDVVSPARLVREANKGRVRGARALLRPS